MGALTEEPIWEPIKHPRGLHGLFATKGHGLYLPGKHVPVYHGADLTFGKSAGGSNGARWAFHKNGSRWLVKHYQGDRDRVATELAANAIYREMGARVPLAGKLRLHDGRMALTYPTLPGSPSPGVFRRFGPSKALGRHFMTDALLANWDVAGLEDDNVLWDEEGRPFRVDQGGTLEYRAMGGPKPFGPVPTEVRSMLEPGGQGRRSMDVSMDGLKRQAREIHSRLTPEKIDRIVKEAGFRDQKMAGRVARNLKARVHWMGRFASGAEPFPGLQEDGFEHSDGPLQEMANVDWIDFHFDPLKHPRDEHGRFRDTLAGQLKGFQKKLRIGKVTVSRDKKTGGYSVTRSGKISKFSSAGSAARAALDASARGTEETSLGGRQKFKDYNDYLAKFHGVNPSEPGTFNGESGLGPEALNSYLGELKTELATAEASTNQGERNGIPVLAARVQELQQKIASSHGLVQGDAAQAEQQKLADALAALKAGEVWPVGNGVEVTYQDGAYQIQHPEEDLQTAWSPKKAAVLALAAKHQHAPPSSQPEPSGSTPTGAEALKKLKAAGYGPGAKFKMGDLQDTFEVRDAGDGTLKIVSLAPDAPEEPLHGIPPEAFLGQVQSQMNWTLTQPSFMKVSTHSAPGPKVGDVITLANGGKAVIASEDGGLFQLKYEHTEIPLPGTYTADEILAHLNAGTWTKAEPTPEVPSVSFHQIGTGQIFQVAGGDGGVFLKTSAKNAVLLQAKEGTSVEPGEAFSADIMQGQYSFVPADPPEYLIAGVQHDLAGLPPDMTKTLPGGTSIRKTVTGYQIFAPGDTLGVMYGEVGNAAEKALQIDSFSAPQTGSIEKTWAPNPEGDLPPVGFIFSNESGEAVFRSKGLNKNGTHFDAEVLKHHSDPPGKITSWPLSSAKTYSKNGWIPADGPKLYSGQALLDASGQPFTLTAVGPDQVEGTFDNGYVTHWATEDAEKFLDDGIWNPAPAKPPAAPRLKVGDVVSSAEQMDKLPAGSVVATSPNPQGYVKHDDGMWEHPSGVAYASTDFGFAAGGLTVKSLPGGVPQIGESVIGKEKITALPEGTYVYVMQSTGNMGDSPYVKKDGKWHFVEKTTGEILHSSNFAAVDHVEIAPKPGSSFSQPQLSAEQLHDQLIGWTGDEPIYAHKADGTTVKVTYGGMGYQFDDGSPDTLEPEVAAEHLASGSPVVALGSSPIHPGDTGTTSQAAQSAVAGLKGVPSVGDKITAHSQMDALPLGSVVKDHQYKGDQGYVKTPDGWKLAGGGNAGSWKSDQFPMEGQYVVSQVGETAPEAKPGDLMDSTAKLEALPVGAQIVPKGNQSPVFTKTEGGKWKPDTVNIEHASGDMGTNYQLLSLPSGGAPASSSAPVPVPASAKKLTLQKLNDALKDLGSEPLYVTFKNGQKGKLELTGATLTPFSLTVGDATYTDSKVQTMSKLRNLGGGAVLLSADEHAQPGASGFQENVEQHKLKDLNVAVGDVIQYKKGGWKYTVIGVPQEGSTGSNYKVQAANGTTKNYSGHKIPQFVQKADGSKLSAKEAAKHSAKSAGEIKALLKEPSAGSLTMGELPEGAVIGTPDGQVGILKPSEGAYEGYVKAYNIQNGQSFEPPKDKKPVLLSTDPAVMAEAAKTLAAAQSVTNVTSAPGAATATADDKGPPPQFAGALAIHSASVHLKERQNAAHLTQQQQKAVATYVGSSSDINSALRNSEGILSSGTAEKAKHMMDAMTATVEKPTVIVRKTTLQSWTNAKPGQVVQDNGFFSASWSPTAISTGGVYGGGSHAVELHVMLRPGDHFVYPNAFGEGLGSEQEVILPRGSLFKVLKSEKAGGVTRLYVETF